MRYLRPSLAVLLVWPLVALTPVPARAASHPGSAPTSAAHAVARRSNPVGVPSRYVYNPRLGSLNDYCTKSPDGDGAKADFRGPCARHDLCIDDANQAWPHDASRRKQHQLTVCNPQLDHDMTTNCDASYTPKDHRRYTCRSMAKVYRAAVMAYTVVKGGRTGLRAVVG